MIVTTACSHGIGLAMSVVGPADSVLRESVYARGTRRRGDYAYDPCTRPDWVCGMAWPASRQGRPASQGQR